LGSPAVGEAVEDEEAPTGAGAGRGAGHRPGRRREAAPGVGDLDPDGVGGRLDPKPERLLADRVRVPEGVGDALAHPQPGVGVALWRAVVGAPAEPAPGT